MRYINSLIEKPTMLIKKRYKRNIQPSFFER